VVRASNLDQEFSRPKSKQRDVSDKKGANQLASQRLSCRFILAVFIQPIEGCALLCSFGCCFLGDLIYHNSCSCADTESHPSEILDHLVLLLRRTEPFLSSTMASSEPAPAGGDAAAQNAKAANINVDGLTVVDMAYYECAHLGSPPFKPKS
jgi:hypothetical protein